MIFMVGWFECLVVLLVLGIVVALSFRFGAVRGRRRGR
jgi:hypothetical protein